jgi:hypothetical protein
MHSTAKLLLKVVPRWVRLRWNTGWNKPLFRGFHAVLFCGLSILFIWWIPYCRLPLPGWASGVIAVIGSLTSVMILGPWQKALYLFLIAGFLSTEFRAIRKDHKETADQQAQLFEEQKRGFEPVSGQAARNFNSTIGRLQGATGKLDGLLNTTQSVATLETQNLSKVGEAINTVTGGDTFCYVDFDEPHPRLGTSFPDNISSVGVHKVGPYPLYGISVLVVDNELANYRIQHSPTPPSIPQQVTLADTSWFAGDVGTEYKAISFYEVAPSDAHDFQVSISSFTSFPWSEYFSMRKVGGKWKTALFIDVSGTHPQTRAYYRVDDGYPLRADGTPEGWMWPTQKGKKKWIFKLPPHP